MNILFVLFIVGVGVKSGIMPLHSWLPAAMVAPTPVSALLHAVAVVKSGAFGVLRVTGFVFGPETMRAHGLDILLASFAGATISRLTRWSLGGGAITTGESATPIHTRIPRQ